MKFERNIPITDGRRLRRKYPWPDMKVGDSIAYPVSPVVLRASAFKYTQRYGGKIIVREDRAIDGARAWRVE